MKEVKQINLEQNVMGFSSEFISSFSDLENYEVVLRFTLYLLWA
jgi:hypothetical protein